MARVLGIDPGPTESALVIYDTTTQTIVDYGKHENNAFLNHVNITVIDNQVERIAIEMVASYGMPVGETIFQTVYWIGRISEFIRAFTLGTIPKFIYRKDVKLHLCNSPRANDASIRQALIDRFGAPGTKKNPGVLYGIKKDLWAALSVAVTYSDLYMPKD